jgi:opacity protein-like surface antigen
MKIITLLAVLLSFPAFADGYMALGKSIRPGAMNAAVGYEFYRNDRVGLAADVEYIDFGRQPHTVTRNRVLNLDLLASYRLLDNVNVYAKAGVTSSMFSDPYNDYKHDKSFKGHNVGVGVQYMLNKSWGIQAFANNVYYQECSQDKMNHYLTSSLGIVYKFK